VYDHDSNFIHATPIPSRSAQNILEAYQKVIELFTKRGLKPV
jgi:hypothetical protein